MEGRAEEVRLAESLEAGTGGARWCRGQCLIERVNVDGSPSNRRRVRWARLQAVVGWWIAEFIEASTSVEALDEGSSAPGFDSGELGCSRISLKWWVVFAAEVAFGFAVRARVPSRGSS